MMTDLEWAINQMVHKKRGLSKQLADVIGTSQQVLLNKVNPEVQSNSLHAHEAFKIMKHTGDITILEVMADGLGYKLVKDESKPVPILDALLNVVKEHGDIGVCISSAMTDGIYDEEEERYTVQQINEARRALELLECSIHTLAKSSRGA
jgi:hypothetical protein